MQPNPISIIIVEDEPIWAIQIQLLAEQFGFEVAGCFTDSASAITGLSKTQFDIALLDIEMDGKNVGIELGKLIAHLYKKPFVFITGSLDKHTAQDALTAKPQAYLTKPVNATSLYVAIHQALTNFQQDEIAAANELNNSVHSFFVKVGNRYKKLMWKDVFALESDKKYTKVFLINSDEAFYYISNTLVKTLEHVVPKNLSNNFVQINRSEAINIDYIQEIKANQIITSVRQFEASESYLPNVKKKLNLV